MRSDRSNTVTSCPTRVSCCAAARPPGPEPTTATRWSERVSGSCGTIQPSSKARSAIACSTTLILTGSALIAKNACLLAWCRTHASGELREVVRCMQPVAGRTPVVAPHGVIPVGDEIAQWAATVTERDTAIHAASRLATSEIGIGRLVHLVKVADAYVHGRRRCAVSRGVVEEAARISHAKPPWCRGQRPPRTFPAAPLRSEPQGRACSPSASPW